ncbi:MAG: excinuclease ABC subunit UvrC [Lentisphaeria bacterium]
MFRNSAAEVIYVGKAKSLRKRVSSYFQPSRQRTSSPKLRSLLKSIAYFEFHEVKNETEALLLESRLIKQYSPRYNTALRDDKRFLLIVVDPSEEFPRLGLTRIKKQDNRIYFGPFPNPKAVRQTMHYLAKHFGLRTCKTRAPDAATHEHCLESVIHDCSRPCLKQITIKQYNERLKKALQVLRGASREVEANLKKEMQELASRYRFEDAAQRRDMTENIRHVCQGYRLRSFERARLKNQESEDNVQALQKALGLHTPPVVLECVDISNIGGLMAVGSIVCFKEGKASPRDYRRYRIRTIDQADDYGMMREVVSRRYTRIKEEGAAPPDLLIIDGGRGQLNAALEALSKIGLPPFPVVGLAKQEEEIYIPTREKPLRLPRPHIGLRLVQAARDEAHRFAINYHKRLRRQRISQSVLDEIEGVGPRRRADLLREFGSVARLRKAKPEELVARIPGLGPKLAKKISYHLQA